MSVNHIYQNTTKRKFMVELLHDIILYKITNSTIIDRSLNGLPLHVSMLDKLGTIIWSHNQN